MPRNFAIITFLSNYWSSASTSPHALFLVRMYGISVYWYVRYASSLFLVTILYLELYYRDDSDVQDRCGYGDRSEIEIGDRLEIDWRSISIGSQKTD